MPSLPLAPSPSLLRSQGWEGRLSPQPPSPPPETCASRNTDSSLELTPRAPQPCPSLPGEHSVGLALSEAT